MKGLEVLKSFQEPQMMADDDWCKRIEIIEKELKAIDILRKCKLTIEKDFSINSCFIYGKLSQDYYDLLKEVLC